MAALSRSEVYTGMAGKGKHRKGYRRPVARRDEGTPELQAKRLAIVGHQIDPKTRQRQPRDTSKSITPLAAMEVRGILTADQHAAGRRYAWLYMKAINRRIDGMQTGGGDAVACCLRAGTPCKDCTAAKIQAAWVRAHKAIPDRRAKDALENATVYGRWPRWFVALIGGLLVHRPSDHAERVALMRGLDALVAIGCVMREKE
jgi:hypothetical protein